ncbi:MAG TPA: aminoglycoside phosphotransferase family protein [Propionibacteriaceae bacterium]
MGPAGASWQAGLPQVLAELARRWHLTLGRPLPGGSASYVVAATSATGAALVVKVCLPDPGLDAQAQTLVRADGRGYARLVDYDATHGAMLLERLGRSLEVSGRTPVEQLGVLARTLALAWQDPGDTAATPKAADLAVFIRGSWERLGRPCSERVVRQALVYAGRRAADPGEPVVVHGDPHPGNALAATADRPGAATGYCFVDPDGFVADRAYDLGVALRGWSSQLTGSNARAVAQSYAQVLAEHSGVDATRIWEWGFVERVSTGLYVLEVVRSPAVARPFLRTAELLVDPA